MINLTCSDITICKHIDITYSGYLISLCKKCNRYEKYAAIRQIKITRSTLLIYYTYGKCRNSNTIKCCSCVPYD